MPASSIILSMSSPSISFIREDELAEEEREWKGEGLLYVMFSRQHSLEGRRVPLRTPTGATHKGGEKMRPERAGCGFAPVFSGTGIMRSVRIPCCLNQEWLRSSAADLRRVGSRWKHSRMNSMHS